MLLVTYNIQWGRGRDNVIDLARIARTIADADIIALQEVERHWRPETGDQPEQFAALFPEHFWVFGAAVDIDGSSRRADGRVVNIRRQYGNLILSRWPIVSVRSWALSKYPVHGHMNDQSILLETVIAAPGGAFRFYNTHLNYLAAEQRRQQVEEVLAVIADAPRQGPVVVGDGLEDDTMAEVGGLIPGQPRPDMPAPAILTGDFNMECSSAEYIRIVGGHDPNYGRLFAADRLADALTVAGVPEGVGITFPEKDGEAAQRIDHFFVTYDLVGGVRRGWIDADADGSDHQPVWLELDRSGTGR